jgi:two-component system, NarL family, response regulator NreC
MEKRIKVLLVDDHKIFREGIESMFLDNNEIYICAAASEGEEAWTLFQVHQPDIVVLDISMPLISGTDLAQRIRNENEEVKILMLSMHINDAFIFRSIRAGANGYLSKEETSREELANAIKILASGKEYFSKKAREIMQQNFLDKARNNEHNKEDFATLTKREKEVLKSVLEGLSNQEIAEKLFLSIRTVETHKTRILQKLNKKNIVELIKYAIHNQIWEF